MENLSNSKLNALKELIDKREKEEKGKIEINVEGLGWLVILLQDFEIVEDDWYASQKYNSSKIINTNNSYITLKNVYKKKYSSHYK